MIKKSICFILILLQLFTLCVFAESDYSNHWAKEDIELLLEEKKISGDSRGIRPDDSITRAEFAKIANLIFSFSEASQESFPDVDDNKWYSNDMKIAKKNGYMVGDASGYVYPENNVTRAEACVMYARILNLDPPPVINIFEDDGEIPVWARDAIYALNRAGLILGYVDGTFQSSKPMTRAEVFSLSSRMLTISKSKDNDEESLNKIGAAPVTSPNQTTGGGGGGGGGGAGNIPNNIAIKLPVPIVRNIDSDKMNITWDAVPNAVSYEVYIERTTVEPYTNSTFASTNRTVSIENCINSLMVNKKPTEKFRVKVRAIASNSAKNSDYSSYEEFTVINPSVPLPRLSVNQNYDTDGNEEISITWQGSSQASEYIFKMDFGSGYEALTVIDNKVVIPDEKLKQVSGKQKVSFQAISNQQDILDSEILETEVEIPLFAGQEGTSNLIFNQRHFENIKNKKDGSFIIAKPLTLTDYSPISDFKGTITAKDNCPVTLSVNKPDEGYIGLFATADSAVIKNITVEGSISGKEFVGAILGEDINGTLIEGCTNKATITSSDGKTGGIVGRISKTGIITMCANKGVISSKGADVGGIAGSTIISGSARISNCENRKNVSGYQRVGGIVGILMEENNIYSCRNEGSISAESGNVAGVCGYAQGNIYDCYNIGNVEGSGASGGIVGMTETAVAIANCYNNGEINSTGNYSSGIVAYIGGTNCVVTISNCYNTGIITSDKGAAYNLPVYSFAASDSNVSVSITKCYYLTGQSFSEQKTDTVSISDEELKNLNLGEGFKLNHSEGNPSYKYPQIVTNPHVSGIPLKPENIVITKGELGKVTVSWSNNEDSYYEKILVTVYCNGVAVSGYSNKDFSFGTTEFDFYETETQGEYRVELKAANGENAFSEISSGTFYIDKAHCNTSFAKWLNEVSETKDIITPVNLDN